MSRHTRVLSLEEVKFLHTVGTESEEDHMEMKEEDSLVEESLIECDTEEEHIEKEEDEFEDTEDMMEQKLLKMSPEQINDLMSKLELEELEKNKNHDMLEGEDDKNVQQIQENKNKAKVTKPPKQEKKITSKANKQVKKEQISEKVSENEEPKKSKRGKNKTTELPKEENKDEAVSIDDVAETHQKKGRNKKQRLQEEIKTDPVIEHVDATVEEELPLRQKNKERKRVAAKGNQENDLVTTSEDVNHAKGDADHSKGDSKSKKAKKGKGEPLKKEEDFRGDTQNNVIDNKNVAQGATSKNSKVNLNKNKAKVKSEKPKVLTTEIESFDEEPKLSENIPQNDVKSIKGKQITATNSKARKDPKENVKKDGTETEECLNERPKRNVTKKDYCEKPPLYVPKVKKGTKNEQSLQSNNNQKPVVDIIKGSTAVDNEKIKPQPKGKKQTEIKENEVGNKTSKISKEKISK